MKNTLRIEELLQFILGIYFFSVLDYQWWWFLVLILLPDIGMIGYIINSKIGAVTYNFMHNKAVAIVFWLIGIYIDIGVVELIGIILFTHAAMDRMFGFGLKYADSFYNTHLEQ
ncbi:DUF4260 domain-containing protein [Lacinutrix sp. Hel_I_90]|uniref:DUF4260 domain-containing protein n=1 Tax=Lacinutrix sp. Hel_I_90 TaxID=1249999 RepID=UPI0005C8791C|nr:DUF4260 domain-containing protein [Lacinutrix sp. Hel_I_90]